jgi:ATPase family associated with various cellular activities (AAA)
MSGSRPSAPIVVAGDITIDWLTWTEQPAAPALSPDDDTPNWRRHQITRRVPRAGGAMLLARMLAHALPGRDVVAPFDHVEWHPPNDVELIESLAELSWDKKKQRYTITQLRGFHGTASLSPAGRIIPSVSSDPAVLALDDAGNGFREPSTDPNGWPNWFHQWKPEWIVLKHGRPLGKAGDEGLWDKLRPRRRLHDEPPMIEPNHLVVVINADDLREHGIKLTPRLFWERTAEDFVRNIGSNGKLVTLTNCRHLLIRFGSEAVIHYGVDRRRESSLYYDPQRSEGDIVASAGGQPMIGLTAAFTAAIAADIADVGTFEPNRAIRRAMRVSAALAVSGFRQRTDDTPDYNLPAIFDVERKDIETFRVTIPSGKISGETGVTWRILENRGDIPELARQVVSFGVEHALGAPVAKYGDLVTADRKEIEAVRAIRNLLDEYIHSPEMKKPLSIAVFGPPGSGKSFTVKQLARELLPNGEKRPPLEFNLSQFNDLSHLIGAFRLIQDRIMATQIPLVFFDEFDCSDGTDELAWLKYFLAPMQDAEFRDSAVTHPLGRAIFVFAGGTSTSFEQFSAPWHPDAPKEEQDRFAHAKGPDFLSRLRGHVNIMGVSEISGSDYRSWPIRRAIVFRYAVKRRAAALFGEGKRLGASGDRQETGGESPPR